MSGYQSVLITGASSGIGEEFARQLAPTSGQIVLVARREERLRSLAAELKVINPSLDVLVFAVDLTLTDKRAEFIKFLLDNGANPDLLINNAGMGDFGKFIESDWAKLDKMIQLNITALTHLTHALLPGMKRRQSGAIINVSSLASILPIPDFSVYAASKAYVTSFSEALRLEVRQDNISVLALCPGPVHTEFGSIAMRADQDNKLPGREQFYVDKAEVVSSALLGIARNRARVYPGWKVALAAAGISILPIAVVRFVMSKRIQ